MEAPRLKDFVAEKDLHRDDDDDNELTKGNESPENPEDTIPDLPENQAAREFLKHAPRKGEK